MRSLWILALAAWAASPVSATGGHVAPGYREVENGILWEFTGGDAGDDRNWRSLGAVSGQEAGGGWVVPPGYIPTVGPDETTGNEFGYWVLKPALRPYFFLKDSDLEDWQRETIKRWEKSPYNMLWIYAIEPGPENDWAGWGPPPRGWTTRRDLPRSPEGAFMGDGLPWPPAGRPGGGWIKR